MKTMFEEYGLAIIVAIIILALLGVGFWFKTHGTTSMGETLKKYMKIADNGNNNGNKPGDGGASGGGGTHTNGSDHNYVEKVAPTCTKDGVEKCECGDERVIPARGHVWVADEDDNSNHICKRCKATEAHSLKTKQAATCTAAGYKQCSKCDYRVKIPATGHNYANIKDATCTTSGTRRCSGCGDEKTIPALGHNFRVKVQPSCASIGTEECTRCNVTRNFGTITGHHYSVVKEATCTEAGVKECDKCYDKQTIAKKGHNFKPYTSATCTKAGSEKCANCGEIRTTDKALGHDYKITKEATCTADGSKRCNRCADVQTVKATGHVYTVTKAATCTETGTKKCNKCASTVSIPATGHSYKAESAATCTKPATEKCLKCNSIRNVGSALGHNYTVTKNATCTEAGSKKCSRCSDVQSLPAIGHNYKADKAATCTAPATEKCANCGSTRSTGSALGHKWVDSGDDKHTCERCKTAEAHKWEAKGDNLVCSECQAKKSLTLVDGETFNSKIPGPATSVVFTDEKAPDGATLTNLADDGRNGVVGWRDGDIYKVSTQITGQKVIANVECRIMFANKINLERFDFINLDTSNIVIMQNMFGNCHGLKELDLSTFDTSNTQIMAGMFYGCNNLTNLNIKAFNTNKLENMQNLVNGCSKLTEIDLSSFDTSKIKYMQNAFNGCKNLQKVKIGSKFNWINVDIDNPPFLPTQTSDNIPGADGKWYDEATGIGYVPAEIPNNTAATYVAVKPKSRTLVDGLTFNKTIPDSATSVVFTDEKAPDGATLTNLGEDGKDGIIGWLDETTFKVSTQSSNVKAIANPNCGFMFNNKSNLKSIDFKNLDTSRVTNMRAMFAGCKGLANLDVSEFDTSKVITMFDMFASCIYLKSLDLSSFDTSQVKNMSDMFGNCNSLTDLDVSGFDTSRTTDMSGMFALCNSLPNLDISTFDTSQVIYMSEMFYACNKLQKVKLGSKFKWVGTEGYLPAQTSSNIPGTDGKWYNEATGVGYAPNEIPNNTAATYVAVGPCRVTGNHDYKVTKAATCSVDGVETCSRCAKTRSINALGHSVSGYSSTCTSDGYWYCTRSGCNYAYSTPGGHNYVTTSATCTTGGETKCSYCGNVASTTRPLGHDRNDPIGDYDGQMLVTCSRCGYVWGC